MPDHSSLFRPGIRSIHPYTPGKPIEQLERELGIRDALKFASNENPHGPSPLVLAALREAMQKANRYADAGCYDVRQELSRVRGFPDDHFVVLSGSSEGIYLSAMLTCAEGDEVVFAHPPSFLLYAASAKVTGATAVPVPLKNHTHDLDALRAAITPRTRLVFICNPNNPTGTSNGQAEVDRYLDGLPGHVLTVFDHAYAEYASRPDYPDLSRYIREGRAVVELRTFSKAYSLASLRVAYVLGHPDLVGYYNRARLPFNVDGMAQAAAVAALRDPDHIRRSVLVNRESLDRIRECLESLGAEVTPSDANFLMVKLQSDSRPIAAELERHGVIVRPLASFGMSPEYIRISSGTIPETERIVEVLRQVLGRVPASK